MKSQADTTISGTRTYTLNLSGMLEDEFVISFCPPETTITREPEAVTLSNIRADQSCLIGLLRQLHNMGCVIISIESK